MNRANRQKLSAVTTAATAELQQDAARGEENKCSQAKKTLQTTVLRWKRCRKKKRHGSKQLNECRAGGLCCYWRYYWQISKEDKNCSDERMSLLIDNVHHRNSKIVHSSLHLLPRPEMNREKMKFSRKKGGETVKPSRSTGHCKFFSKVVLTIVRRRWSCACCNILCTGDHAIHKKTTNWPDSIEVKKKRVKKLEGNGETRELRNEN